MTNDPIPTDSAASPSRALVVIAEQRADASCSRPMAGFVAQLIACNRRLPAFRRSGRAEPGLATGVYGRERAAVEATGRLDLLI